MAKLFQIFRGLGHSITLLWLALANLVPIYGVMKWGWQISEIIFLYGAETMIIVVFAIAKMMTAEVPSPEDGYGIFTILANISAYSALLGCSGVYVYYLLYDLFDAEKHVWAFDWQSGIGLAVTGLLLSYFSMFLFGYVLNGEFKRSQANDAIGKPVFRIFATMAFAFIGGGLSKLFGQPMIALVFLCICKLLWDVLGYLLRNFGTLKVNGEYVYGGPEQAISDKAYHQAQETARVKELDEIRRRIKPDV